MNHWSKIWEVKKRKKIYEWAHENITLPPVITKGHKFEIDYSPHFLQIFDAIADERVREINILAPPRSGKTLIADITVPWAIEFDNASILYVMQTQSMADSHSELRIMPILYSSEYISSILPSDKNKIRNTEILFSTGLPLIITGPAISALQTRSFKYVIIDEAWVISEKYPGRIEEAKARLGDYVRERSSKLLVLSQAGSANSDWHRQYLSGARHEWVIKCMNCDKYFVPLFSGQREDGSRWGLVYDNIKKENGSTDIERALNSIRYICPYCNYEHSNEQKTKAHWKKTGKYERQGDNSNTDRLSFHWNNLIDYPWRELVREWIFANEARENGNDLPLIQFIQKHLAEFPENSEQYEYHYIPAKTIEIEKAYRFLTVDVQATEYWALICDWSKDSEVKVIYADRVYSWGAIEELQKRYGIENQYVAVDCGFNQSEVFAQCAKNGNTVGNKWFCWWAMRGTNTKDFPVRYNNSIIRLPYSYPPQFADPVLGLHTNDARRMELKGRFVPIINWSNPTIKDIALRRRQMFERGEKSYISPEIGDHFVKHLYAERKRQVQYSNGRTEWRWEKIGNRPNHLWDCFCMQIVFACMARIIKIIPDETEIGIT